MRHIAPSIMLDVDKMYQDEKSCFALVYLDESFRSKDRRHNVRKLLRLGWLCCLHRSPGHQKDELWNLINPEMAQSISKADVMDFVQTLVTFAVNINKKVLVIDEEQVQYIVSAIAYLDQALENIEAFTKKLEGELTRRINKEDLIDCFEKNGLFRTYTLRAAIVGKLNAPKKQSQ